MSALPDPTPAAVLAAREAAGLSQAEAARLVHLGGPYRWSEYERGVRAIDAARWELFLAKSGQHPTLRPADAAAEPAEPPRSARQRGTA